MLRLDLHVHGFSEEFLVQWLVVVAGAGGGADPVCRLRLLRWAQPLRHLLQHGVHLRISASQGRALKPGSGQSNRVAGIGGLLLSFLDELPALLRHRRGIESVLVGAPARKASHADLHRPFGRLGNWVARLVRLLVAGPIFVIRLRGAVRLLDRFLRALFRAVRYWLHSLLLLAELPAVAAVVFVSMSNKVCGLLVRGADVLVELGDVTPEAEGRLRHFLTEHHLRTWELCGAFSLCLVLRGTGCAEVALKVDLHRLELLMDVPRASKVPKEILGPARNHLALESVLGLRRLLWTSQHFPWRRRLW